MSFYQPMGDPDVRAGETFMADLIDGPAEGQSVSEISATGGPNEEVYVDVDGVQHRYVYRSSEGEPGQRKHHFWHHGPAQKD